MTEFRYPVPTDSPFVDWRQYRALLISVVDQELTRPDVWYEGDGETAIGYMQDLIGWLMELEVDAVTLPAGIVMQSAAVLASPWIPCDGRAISRAEYPALFAAVGTTYGAGDGATTFNLPDLRGRAAIGSGTGTGLTSRAAGSAVGSETHQLTQAQMPAHSHRTYTIGGPAGASQYAYSYNGPRTDMAWHSGSVETIGGNQAHNNMQPSLVMHFYIWPG